MNYTDKYLEGIDAKQSVNDSYPSIMLTVPVDNSVTGAKITDILCENQ